MRALVVVLAAWAMAGCASTGAVPSPFPRPFPSQPQPEPSAVADPSEIVRTALSLRGAPYRNGGADPSGFDCSGFVEYVFAQQGQHVPRTVAEQYQLGSRVSIRVVAPGDLLFFRTTRASGPTHVGIAISGDEFVHAPAGAGAVRVESLGTPYWAGRFVGAKRLP